MKQLSPFFIQKTEKCWENVCLNTLPISAGVYQICDNHGQVLYVGKAKNLKNRIKHYFSPPPKLDLKTRAMMQKAMRIALILTPTESDALLLECQLIKQLRPRYNISFRDDKSYPCLFLSEHADFPRLYMRRAVKHSKDARFGPYPNSHIVKKTLELLQKLFQIRNCTDSAFKNRSRPCLQYQIKQCTAPCVGYITPEAYREQVRYARLFLTGKSDDVIHMLVTSMEAAAAKCAFEQAAFYRDRIAMLRNIQHNNQGASKSPNMDAIAMTHLAGTYAITVFSIRNHQWVGCYTCLPKLSCQVSESELLAKFLSEYYLASTTTQGHPSHIYLSHSLPEVSEFTAAFFKKWQHPVQLLSAKTPSQEKLMQLAFQNAQQAIKNHRSHRAHYDHAILDLQEKLQHACAPIRLECFDVSHTQGEATIAACVVFGKMGPINAQYRRFAIKNDPNGDDYFAMAQAITRRYAHAPRERFPDVLIIDGGKGQLTASRKALTQLHITPPVMIGIAKGPTRKVADERLFILHPNDTTHHMQFTRLVCTQDSPARVLLDQMRDEAHRFAITGHRRVREKARTYSCLEEISGIGAEKRRLLLRFFGGLQGVLAASVAELCKVPGINRALAQRIRAYLSEDHAA